MAWICWINHRKAHPSLLYRPPFIGASKAFHCLSQVGLVGLLLAAESVLKRWHLDYPFILLSPLLLACIFFKLIQNFKLIIKDVQKKSVILRINRDIKTIYSNPTQSLNPFTTLQLWLFFLNNPRGREFSGHLPRQPICFTLLKKWLIITVRLIILWSEVSIGTQDFKSKLKRGQAVWYNGGSSNTVMAWTRHTVDTNLPQSIS